MNNPCVILAADALTAIGADREAIWSAMMRRQCGLGLTTRFEHGRYLTDIGGEIKDFADDGDWPRVERFAMTVGNRTLSQAQDGGVQVDLSRTGLILATTKADIQPLYDAVTGGNNSRETSQPGILPGSLARMVGAALGIDGPCLAVSNACAAGLVAMIQGVRMLNRGEIDHALVIGAEALSDFTLAGFSCVNAISSKPCRPFDAKRDGLSLGEGAGAVLLARNDDSQTGLGRIEGYAVTNDAGHLVSPSPTGRGLSQAMTGALKMAAWSAGQLDLVNAHGTATVQNDNMESHAMQTVFGDDGPPTFSVKGYFGHTLGAAGVIETVVSLSAMQAGVVPATMGYETSGVDHRVNVCGDHRQTGGIQRVLTVKSGFGGVNAAVAFSAAGGVK